MVPVSAAYWAALSAASGRKTWLSQGLPGTRTRNAYSATLLSWRRAGGRRSDSDGASVTVLLSYRAVTRSSSVWPAVLAQRRRSLTSIRSTRSRCLTPIRLDLGGPGGRGAAASVDTRPFVGERVIGSGAWSRPTMEMAMGMRRRRATADV